MNKPIINGIDVSEWELKGVLIPIMECKYFEGIGNCKESKGLCVANKNCYFKQLKCLQDKYDTVVNKFFNSETDKTRLKKENEKLKEQLCETKQFLKDDSEESSKFCQQIEAYQLSENEAKEIIAELKHKNKELKAKFKKYGKINEQEIMTDLMIDKVKKDNYLKALEEIRSYCDEQNLKADYTACYITNRIDEVLHDKN